MSARHSWTRRQDALLRKLYRTKRLADIARVIGRSAAGIKNRINKLRLRRNIFHQPYSQADERTLRELFPHMPTAKVARRIKRTVESVCGMACKLGLHKSAKYIRRNYELEACRLRVAGAPHRFPKGHVPANKGLRRPGYSLTHGRMAETTFKKGSRPKNYLPLGTVLPNADGYLREKISDFPNNGRGANNKNWEFVHKRVWETAHGPIPKGHRIWWKDGDHTNCKLENLELLSDKEHMARTTIHNMPPQVKHTIYALGTLNRTIGRIKRGEKQDHGSARSSV